MDEETRNRIEALEAHIVRLNGCISALAAQTAHPLGGMIGPLYIGIGKNGPVAMTAAEKSATQSVK